MNDLVLRVLLSLGGVALATILAMVIRDWRTVRRNRRELLRLADYAPQPVEASKTNGGEDLGPLQFSREVEPIRTRASRRRARR